MVSAARRPCVFLRSKLAVSQCRSAHLVQHRSSPEVDLTSTPSMSNRTPPTSISTMEEEAGLVFKIADMVRGYQRLTTLDRDALRPTAWLPGGGAVQLGEPELSLLYQLGRLPVPLLRPGKLHR